MQENKKKMISLGITVMTLLLIVVGATYAYFAAQIDSGASTDVTITAESVDSLTFTTGDPISFSITQDNFKQGGSNLSGNTTATASLIAGKDSNANYNYYVYLDIINNELTYTTEAKTAELILKITGPDGQITYNENLPYNFKMGGFDITEYEGLIKIGEQNISTTTSKEDNWTVEIIFRNLETNQVGNSGKGFKAELKIQKEKINTIADYIKDLYTTNGVNNLYLHDSNLANSAEDGSYRYAGSSDTTNNYVCFGSDATTCPNDNLYRIIGVFGNKVKLIKHDYGTVAQLGADGDNFNNASYTTSSISTYKGSLPTISRYYFNYKGLPDKTINNGKGSNDWETSLLNKTNLNTNYINYLNGQDSKWAAMISDARWNIGGTTTNALTAKGFYDLEKEKQTSTPSKIGIMQISDYGFATAPSNWNSIISNYNSDTIKNDNWMFMGLHEWVITPLSDYASGTMHVYTSGGVYSEVSSNDGYAARPVFYLNSSVEYVSGDGTQSSPYRIAQP